MSKYFSKRVIIDGQKFDSQREADRWLQLRREEENGDIQDLQRQVKFILVPSQKRGGKVVERPLTYIADFTYYRGGEYIVEDVKPKGKDGKVPQYYKGTPAWKDYVIKRKLMLYINNIQIREI